MGRATEMCVCVCAWVKCVANLDIYRCKQSLMIHLMDVDHFMGGQRMVSTYMNGT